MKKSKLLKMIRGLENQVLFLRSRIEFLEEENDKPSPVLEATIRPVTPVSQLEWPSDRVRSRCGSCGIERAEMLDRCQKSDCPFVPKQSRDSTGTPHYVDLFENTCSTQS
jgi:hypothetical protein